jgi:hypothetical protein
LNPSDRESERRGVDGVHVDFANNADSAASYSEQVEEVKSLL